MRPPGSKHELEILPRLKSGSTLDLLSGETVTASKAIISNLTVSDTYGKLVGLSRTPSEIRQELKALKSWGSYLIYLGVDEANADSMLSNHLLASTTEQERYDPMDQILVSIAPAWDPRAPMGKRAVTVHSFTAVEDWFTFTTDESEREERDRSALELVWEKLQQVCPQLLVDAEVIESANPTTFYEQTRRTLGMVGGVLQTPSAFWPAHPPYDTSVPNLYLISDTTSKPGLDALIKDAFVLANRLTSR